jgi:hypothetical protein
LVVSTAEFVLILGCHAVGEANETFSRKNKRMRSNRNFALGISLWGLVVVLAGMGCGSERGVVEPPPAIPLTDTQVRELLQDTMKTGDASSDLYMRFVKQLGSGKDSARDDAAEINNLISEMVVLNDPAKNRQYAKKILEKW